MTKRKILSDEDIRIELADLEIKSESDDDHLAIDSVYDSNNNDAPYISEDIGSDSDSDSCDEPFRENIYVNIL